MAKVRWNERTVETALKIIAGELKVDGDIIVEDGNVYVMTSSIDE